MFDESANTRSCFSSNNRMLIGSYFKIISCFFIVLPLLLEVTSENLTMSKLVGVDFEVYGRVQGVFFRKYTQKRGEELGLKGWCMNTNNGTVVGRIEGEKDKVEQMKHWLQYTGSPQSAVDKAEFRNEKEISAPSFSNFTIKK
ncbi:acylphosphatase-1-like [Osmia bicornis bicornis]|uniref:acylphosphatase-1-like n=1 Tax=Osmia bicornis bicornis TaxID=1437191 RepID=UPI0010F96199|nr:acylphosphatase-1-like [Osmia bicornis bicornis]